MNVQRKLMNVMSVSRRGWLLLAVLLLAAMFGVERSTVWAADGTVELHQTIPTLPPTPTPTPPNTPTPRPPTPTPRPNNGNQGEQPAPTATPVQASDQPAAAPAEEAQETAASPLSASVTALALNVRQGPGTTFAVIGRLTGGAQVTVLGRSADGAWLYICCIPGTQTGGWISAQFVAPGYTTAQLDALPVGQGGDSAAGIGSAGTITSSVAVTGVVSVPALNARAAPSTNDAILGRFASGAQVTVLGRNAAGDWWLVCCAPNGAGNVWVAASFVRSGAEAATLASLPVITGRNAPAATNALAAPVIEGSPTPTAVATPVAPTSAAPAIVLTGPQRLLPAVQGEPVVLLFTVANPGSGAAESAEFAFELPAGLRFVSASATDGGEATESETTSGSSLVVVTWPSLAAGANATVRITAVADEALANGAVLNSSAVVAASNAASTFAPVEVGMPPVALPDFR